MQTEYVLFTVAVEIVGFLLLFQNFRDWKKGITHIRYYPFFGARRLEPIYRRDEPIIFHLVLIWETLMIVGLMATMLYCTLWLYLHEIGFSQI